MYYSSQGLTNNWGGREEIRWTSTLNPSAGLTPLRVKWRNMMGQNTCPVNGLLDEEAEEMMDGAERDAEK